MSANFDRFMGWFFLLSAPFSATVAFIWCSEHSAPFYIFAGLVWGFGAQGVVGWRLLDSTRVLPEKETDR